MNQFEQMQEEQKLIEQYYTKCDFDNECDCCNKPEKGSYAVGYTNDMNGADCDSYICGKCALVAIKGIKEHCLEEMLKIESSEEKLDRLWRESKK